MARSNTKQTQQQNPQLAPQLPAGFAAFLATQKTAATPATDNFTCFVKNAEFRTVIIDGTRHLVVRNLKKPAPDGTRDFDLHSEALSPADAYALAQRLMRGLAELERPVAPVTADNQPF